MINRVFFDLGLTLAESDVPHRYVERFSRLGHLITGEQAQRAYHLANKYFMRERPGELGQHSRDMLRDFLQRVCMELQVPQLGERLFQLTVEDPCPAKWSAFPFAVQALQQLRDRGVKTGLISNWDPSCRRVLQETGLAPYLDPIVVSSEVGVEKPDPRIFRRALELSGDRPENCLYVGDNYYDDGVGASGVGMAYCILNPRRLGIEELDIPWCVPDIRQVGSVLDALNAAR
ncbi:MAG: HAD family hydrolase [Acutalibacter sp.]|jgi:putative hydrolase of the HAD superfamily